MDDSKNHHNIPDIDDDHGLVQDSTEFLGFDCKNYAKSREFFIDMVKYSLLYGADSVLMARKSPTRLNSLKLQSSIQHSHPIEDEAEREKKGIYEKYPLLQSSSKRFDDDTIVCNEEYTDVSKVVNFPLNSLAFLAILVFKSIGFQIKLFRSFFTVPIWLSYSTFMFFLFPFQTLSSIREHLTKRLLRMWGDYYCIRLKSQQSVLNLAIRFGWAFFWSVYVCFVLIGLLVLGFLLGGLAMRRLVEQPIHTTETLNFDYTKASPVAFVPVMSAPGAGVISGMSAENVESVGRRAIPCNHKLQLTVSLTLPESKYNRKLGVFQVWCLFATKLQNPIDREANEFDINKR